MAMQEGTARGGWARERDEGMDEMLREGGRKGRRVRREKLIDEGHEGGKR